MKVTAGADRVQATVDSGVVEGLTDGEVSRFLGIPYAAAPFGANRMRSPQPVRPWDGVREAHNYGPTAPKLPFAPCYRHLVPEVDIPGDECLNLNIWTPNSSDNLPVLVFIPGGGFLAGSGSIHQYEGSAFARDGVVCVTINYRVGAEGFLHLGDGQANLGLLDQLAALTWVQENIAAFGGDPSRVTVAGESAGAISVTTLLSMERSRGLFSRAIAQSGAALHILTDELGRTVSRRLAQRLGIEPTRDAFRKITPSDLSRAVSALVDDDVQATPDPVRWGTLALTLTPFAPSVDGEILTIHPLDALRSGAGASVPLLTGFNRDEGRFFLLPSGVIDAADDVAVELAAQGYGLSEQGLKTYRTNRVDASPGDILADLFGDWMWVIPALRVAEARPDNAETWVYRFDHPADRSNHGFGAAHAAELPYVFDTIDQEPTHALIGDSPSRAVADTVHRTWVRFIQGSSPGWRVYDSDDRHVGVFSSTGMQEESDPCGDERVAWDGCALNG